MQQMEKATETKCPFKRFMKKSVFVKATVALVLVFFVLTTCVIGGFSGFGKQYFASWGSKAAFYLDFNEDEEHKEVPLKEVYVNFGTVYDTIGKDFSVEFEHMSNLGDYSDRWVHFGKKEKEVFGNVYAQDIINTKGTNYNWIKLFDFEKKDEILSTSHCLVRMKFNADMFVNEVVFVDQNGDVIPTYVTRSEVKEFFEETNWKSGYRELFADEKKSPDIVNLVDSQHGYTAGRTAYSKFTPDEMYTLMQIDNLRLGGRTVNGAFVSDRDFGPFSVLLPYLGTLIFGNNPFGLRIFSVLFSTGLLIAAYLLGKRLFKSEGFGFLFALLAALGGTVITVGRLGLAYPMLAFLTVAAFLFMFRFFEEGISRVHPVKSSLNILASGLFFAFAFATDAKSVFSLLGLVPLFICGALRQSKAARAEAEAVRKEYSDMNMEEQSDERIMENLAERDRRAHLIQAENSYITRIMWTFFIVAFIFATAFITIVSAIPSYYTYAKLYEGLNAVKGANFFALIWKALMDTFDITNRTGFTVGNAMNAAAWFLPLKGATLFNASVFKETYIALNVQLNFGMSVTALIGFLFMTIYTIVYFATGRENSPYASAYTPRILNAYFLLTAGLLTSLLQYIFIGKVSAAQSLLFSVFYVGFIVLTIYTAFVHDTGKSSCVLGISLNKTMKVTVALVAVYAVIFLLSVPMLFSIPVSPTAAKACFGWTTFLNNGIYRM